LVLYHNELNIAYHYFAADSDYYTKSLQCQ